MNTRDLKKLLRNLNVPSSYCSLNGIELPDRIILSKESGKWLVYYFSERGNRSSEKYFSTEDEACQYIYDHMIERKNILDSFK